MVAFIEERDVESDVVSSALSRYGTIMPPWLQECEVIRKEKGVSTECLTEKVCSQHF